MYKPKIAVLLKCTSFKTLLINKVRAYKYIYVLTPLCFGGLSENLPLRKITIWF